MMQIEIGWVLAAIGGMAGAITGLAGIMWAFVKERLTAQDTIISNQQTTITKLQDDVDRLSRGCGHPDCHWTQRSFPRIAP
jgi:hypothetical protein